MIQVFSVVILILRIYDSIENAMHCILIFCFCKHDPHIYHPYPILLGRQPKENFFSVYIESK